MRSLRLALVVLLALGLAATALAQSTGVLDREIQRFVLPGTNTTGLRVHASSSHMTLSLPRGNIWASGGYKVPFTYAHGENTLLGLSNSAMPLAGTVRPGDSGSGVPYQRVPYKGSVIGIAIGASTALTTGTATAEATILRGGSVVATGLTAVLSALGSTQYNATEQGRDIDTFLSSEAVGCRLTTSATMAPTTAEMVCTVIVEF